MADPRTIIVEERLNRINHIIAVSGGKGGVGKSLFASILALILAKKDYKVGLFDLDFTSPSTHVILGAGDVYPTEEKGVIPPQIHGMKYMSIIYYSGNKTAPLRGADVSNALIELLTIVKWGKLDYLILDLPPGIGDATLDIIRFIKRIKFLVVTTSSQLAFETVKKLTDLLKKQGLPIIGIIENMKMTQSKNIRKLTEAMDLIFLGAIPYDKNVEEAIGKADKLLSTTFAENARLLITKIQEFRT